jgi:hypothetical protein
MILSSREGNMWGDEELWSDMCLAIEDDDVINKAEDYAREVVKQFGLGRSLFYPNAIYHLVNMVRSGDYDTIADKYFSAGFTV